MKCKKNLPKMPYTPSKGFMHTLPALPWVASCSSIFPVVYGAFSALSNGSLSVAAAQCDSHTEVVDAFCAKLFSLLLSKFD